MFGTIEFETLSGEFEYSSIPRSDTVIKRKHKTSHFKTKNENENTIYNINDSGYF